jgi:integrase/recombinase XerD
MTAPRRHLGRYSEDCPPEARRWMPELWPKADRAAWVRAVAEAEGPFDQPGPAASWAVKTRRARAGAWGNFLAFLDARGDLDRSGMPADRLTPARLTAWLAASTERWTANTARQIVAELTLAIAAMVPDRDWSWVRRHPARPREAEARASRKLVAPIDLALLVERALDLCIAADAAPPSHSASRDHRDGLLLALTAYVGLRRYNIAALRLGESLQVIGGGYRLVVSRSDVKNGEPVDVPVPTALVPHLRRYLEVHRPRLLKGRPDPGPLWISGGGRPIGYGWLYNLFRTRGMALIGQAINPHVIRHAIASGLLQDDPRDVEVAGAVLAHRGSRSVNEVYDRTGRAAAQAEWRRISDLARAAGG